MEDVKSTIQYPRLESLTARSPIDRTEVSIIAIRIKSLDELALTADAFENMKTLSQKISLMEELASTPAEKDLAKALAELANYTAQEKRGYLRQGIKKVNRSEKKYYDSLKSSE